MIKYSKVLLVLLSLLTLGACGDKSMNPSGPTITQGTDTTQPNP